MEATSNNLIEEIKSLKSYQRDRLLKIIQDLSIVNHINTEELALSDMICRKCGKTHFIKNGHSPGGHQRYKCKECNSSQSADANTPLYNLKLKHKWSDFVFIMLDMESSKTCQSIADKLYIDKKTAHSWRHKFTTSLSNISPLELSEELEVDEIYLPFTVKGVIGKEKYDIWEGVNHPDNKESDFRIIEQKKEEEKYQNIFLCIHNRNDDFTYYPIKTLKKGIVSEADLNLIFNKLKLKNRTIITDSEPSMKASLKNIDGINHLTFKSYEIKKGILKQKNIHNNNINNTMKLLKDWLKDFHGVSTKYLQNYLNWFRFIRLFDFSKIKKIIGLSLSDKTTYSNFKLLFENYKNFASI